VVHGFENHNHEGNAVAPWISKSDNHEGLDVARRKPSLAVSQTAPQISKPIGLPS
jgi:hypothetical protein